MVNINKLSNNIIGSAIEVHKALGPGLLESAYEECMCHEMKLKGLSFERQKPLLLVYKGKKLDCSYRLDLVVEGAVILEIKACQNFEPIHKAQLLTYLKLTGLTTLGLLDSGYASAQAQDSNLPNIVLFFLDDSGHGDYTHNGNPTISTPNITKLTQDGVSFSQFYVTTAACSASRYSLLTGRYPGRSGLGQWVIGPDTQRHLHAKEITIAEGLKTKGYKTGMFGK